MDALIHSTGDLVMQCSGRLGRVFVANEYVTTVGGVLGDLMGMNDGVCECGAIYEASQSRFVANHTS